MVAVAIRRLPWGNHSRTPEARSRDAVAPRNIRGPDGGRSDEHTPLLLDRERIRGAFEPLWKEPNDAKPPLSPSTAEFQCIVPGNPNIVNIFLAPAGEPGFLNWQTLSHGNKIHDVAYFVAISLTVADPRAIEESIVRSYKEAKRRQGGPCVEWEDA
ncbi:kinase-like domain-containing protein [Apiospora marii]|uniref:Kinase-like domain-containing protein n=1 Tax=Apiospora marii TaxID=335849 RepID=A0ABR1R0D0_9PEZI